MFWPRFAWHPNPSTPNQTSIDKMGSYNEAFNTEDFDSKWLELLHPLEEATRKVKAE